MTPEGSAAVPEFIVYRQDGPDPVNKRAVAKARELIDAQQYRVRSRWADVQPRAALHPR